MPRTGQRRTRSAARRADVTVTDKEAGEPPSPDNGSAIVMVSAAPPESPPVADPSDAGQPVCSPEDVVGFPPLSASSGKASCVIHRFIHFAQGRFLWSVKQASGGSDTIHVHILLGQIGIE